MYIETARKFNSADKHFYAYLGSLLNSKLTTFTLRDKTNNIISDESDIAECFAEELQSMFTKVNVEVISILVPAPHCESALEIFTFFPEKTKAAIMSLKPVSAQARESHCL